jgi:hypothetical protein
MEIDLTIKELKILKKLLSQRIEKSIGISEPQETYIQNIDSGMTIEDAETQFTKDNKKYKDRMRIVNKDPLFVLLYKLSRS